MNQVIQKRKKRKNGIKIENNDTLQKHSLIWVDNAKIQHLFAIHL